MNTPLLGNSKIALLSPIAWRTPPRKYGPWEFFVSLLCEGLVSRGVDVTLFATGDSITNGKLRSVAPTSWEETPDMLPKVWECLHISEVFENADEFDLIHNSFDFLPLTYSGLVDTPMVTTLHGLSSPQILPVYEKYNFTNSYISISNADRAPNLDYLATILHGIRTEEYSVSDKPGDYLFFMGRLHHDKGAAESIEIAKAIGIPLVMSGLIQNQDYFDTLIAPHIDGKNVQFIGTIGPDEKMPLLTNAYAFLHLINFDEPFGFSVAEAMASGTPVIAHRRGSMPELIDNGVSGFIVESREQAIAAIHNAHTLDRQIIRDHAVAKFGVDRMVDEYIDAYRLILGR